MSAVEDDRGVVEVGGELVVLLAGLVRAVSFYDRNNVAVTRLIDGILAALARAPGREVRLQLLTDEFFVNGRLMRVDAQLYERATGLAESLERLGVGEIVFGSEVERGDVEQLAERLAECARSTAAKLEVGSIGGIALGASAGGSIASYRFEPDRLAIAAFGGLLGLVDRVYAEYAEGRTPSLLLVKRTLQLVIDGMHTNAAPYLLLAALRDPAQPFTPTRLRVNTAVHAIGFGIALDLPRGRLMTLGLGAVLANLSGSGDPDAAVEPLFRYAGLGESAMELTIAVFDAHRTRRSQSAGVPGQILALAQAYNERTLGAQPPAQPQRFLKPLASGEFKMIDARIAQLFAAWLGPFPIGSLVRLEDGRVGVVMSQGPGPEGRARPFVSFVTASGELGDPVDLRGEPGAKIVGVPTLQETGIRLIDF